MGVNLLKNTDLSNILLWHQYKQLNERLVLMNEAYEDEKLAPTQIYFWYKRFKDGRKSIADDSKSGRPLTSTTDRNIGQVHLIKTANNDSDFEKKTIITCDEKWCSILVPQTKKETLEWNTPSSPKKKKVNLDKSKEKVMLVVFIDIIKDLIDGWRPIYGEVMDACWPRMKLRWMCGGPRRRSPEYQLGQNESHDDGWRPKMELSSMIGVTWMGGGPRSSLHGCYLAKDEVDVVGWRPKMETSHGFQLAQMELTLMGGGNKM
ncbi:hypothetical protein LAZ67_2006622 [Cordylochernes scorpioides]|uniref:Mos1 transposase HTH domain-containing protein n=1 Tax=Cordylochernes scorpioides TaxID=51811 RepID=A0ABY6K8E7_9ARAC|nr:hypothetical protein LAZ67_2006622 [Cordylochernes scorpioides]